MLDPDDLRSFQTIARYQSLTAAARVLRVGQPALTSAVQRLEQALSTTLLLRTNSGVVPTATGRRLLAHATEILALLSEAADRSESAEVGSFVVGCNSSLGEYFLGGLLRDLSTRAPGVELRIRNASSSATRHAVIAGDVHLGVVVNPLPHAGLCATPLFRDAVDFFVRPEDALAADAPLDRAWAQLRSSPLVFAGPVEQSRQMLELLVENRAMPTRLIGCDDLSLVRSLAAAGVGAGLLPRRVAASAALQRLHEKLPFIADAIYAIHTAALLDRPAHRILLEAVLAHGARLAGS